MLKPLFLVGDIIFLNFVLMILLLLFLLELSFLCLKHLYLNFFGHDKVHQLFVFSLDDHLLHQQGFLGFALQFHVFIVDGFVVALIAYSDEFTCFLVLPLLADVGRAN